MPAFGNLDEENMYLLSLEEAVKIRKKCKEKGRKVVFTNGCFDIIHVGHIRLLKEASKLGDVLIIGLNSDDSVRKIKGPTRPINPLPDRAEILSSIRYVDYVIAFEEETPYRLINILLPDILVKGGDYKRDEIVGADIVEANGGKVVTIPLVEGKSTTRLIEEIKAKYS